MHGAQGLQHAKFHQNLTIGRLKNVEFIHAPGECDFGFFLLIGMVMQFAPGNGGDAVTSSMCQE